MRLLSLTLSLVAPVALLAQGTSPEIPFIKHTIDLGRNESCAVADINGDGRLDIVSGEHWYEAPHWKKHTHRKIGFFNNYIDDFSNLPLDVDRDGDIDLIAVSWGARRISWFENPGRGEGLWKEHVIDEAGPVEFAFLVDLNNDGKAEELLPQFGGRDGATAWYEREVRGGEVVWKKHVASGKLYGHGIGAGDVNGDGRTDILTPKGWLEAPADPRQSDWKLHEDYAFDKHLGFLFVHDVDGDGRNDIVSSYAHDYGVFWLQNMAAGDKRFELRLIDDAWSQAHAVTMVDLTGNGSPELVTGKRFYAHNGRDPGGREPLGVYWYEKVAGGGGIEWVRHVIDYGGRTGGGMQIPVVDIDGDGDLDLVMAGKGGLFLFENRSADPSGR